MRALLLVVVSALGVFAGKNAAAQDTPASPPETASPEPPPAAPPPEPSPAPPAAAPEAPPPAPTPPPAPPPPPPKASPPTPITLEETPDEPLPTKPGKAGAAKPKARHRHPKTEEGTPPPPSPSPREEVPLSAAKPALEPAPGEKNPGAEDEDYHPKHSEGDGLLGPFRIGGLVGIGLPSLLSFGGMIKLTRFFGAGLNVGLIPAIKLSLYGDAQLSYQEYDLYGRLFPFGGDLFLGAGVGYASIKGSFSSSYNVSAYQSVAPNLPSPLFIASVGSVRTLVLTPTIGLLHIFASGFTFGVDLGAQIPLAPSQTHFNTLLPAAVPQQVIDQYVKPSDKKVQDTLDTVGRTILPTLNIRAGWMI